MKRILCAFVFILLMSSLCFGQNFKEDTIVVGDCEVNVYIAETDQQKARGMLGFTDASFNKEGMIFTGSTPKKHYFHTVGMKMDIRIIGVNTVGHKKYKVNGGAVYSPPGKRVITIYGDSVFEVPEVLYQQRFQNCLFDDGTIDE